MFTGYLPFAPGTFASIAAVGIFLIPGFESPPVITASILIFLSVGIWTGDYFEKEYGKDPSQFTLDEFVGTWIALLFTPKTPLFILFTFIIWRFFDIVKPYPANKVEEFDGGIGIMLDDVVSGMYSCIIIFIFKFFFY